MFRYVIDKYYRFLVNLLENVLGVIDVNCVILVDSVLLASAILSYSVTFWEI